MTSDSHLRQMKIFRENAGGMMDSFSREFETAYMETLRRRHGTQRMNANNVYQEVIQDKHHVHMNSTKWATLTDFVQYVGKKGLCVVEETERGWYVTYIERDPALLARQEAVRKKTEADQREERLVAKQREKLRMEAARALDRAGCEVERKASEIGEREEGLRMEMKLGAACGIMMPEKKKRKGRAAAKITLLEDADDEDENDANPCIDIGVKVCHSRPKQQRASQAEGPKKLSSKRSLERNGNEPEKKAAKKHNANVDCKEHRKDYWLYRDIVVRIISKELAKGEYYKRKAVVDRVIDRFQAEVEVLESSRKSRDGGDVLRIDQDDLETVIPKELGEKVRIVNGKYRGRKARVERLDKRRYCAELRLAGDIEAEIVELSFDDFSKLA